MVNYYKVLGAHDAGNGYVRLELEADYGPEHRFELIVLGRTEEYLVGSRIELSTRPAD